MTPAGMDGLPYRLCVGMVLVNADGRVFVGQRRGNHVDAWQMPQGGVDKDEDFAAAALRELREETGIAPDLVRIEGRTARPLTYDLPPEIVPSFWGGRYRGQAQTWFLLRYLGRDDQIDIATAHPEFTTWKWARLQDVVDAIVPFKRAVYEQVMAELGPLIPGPDGHSGWGS